MRARRHLHAIELRVICEVAEGEGALPGVAAVGGVEEGAARLLVAVVARADNPQREGGVGEGDATGGSDGGRGGADVVRRGLVGPGAAAVQAAAQVAGVRLDRVVALELHPLAVREAHQDLCRAVVSVSEWRGGVG